MVMNAHREARGEPEISLKEFRRTVEAAMELTNVPREFTSRYLNEGFSGGEKKRMEILQLALQQPAVAILDETDSGLDIDALNTVAHGVNTVAAGSDMGVLIITHYQRILHMVQPNRVSIMFEGRIVKEGGPELVTQIENTGYAAIRAEVEAAARAVGAVGAPPSSSPTSSLPKLPRGPASWTTSACSPRPAPTAPRSSSTSWVRACTPLPREPSNANYANAATNDDVSDTNPFANDDVSSTNPFANDAPALPPREAAKPSAKPYAKPYAKPSAKPSANANANPNTSAKPYAKPYAKPNAKPNAKPSASPNASPNPYARNETPPLPRRSPAPPPR